MRIQATLSSFFNIRPGEGRSTSLMLVHSFFMGLSTVFFETAASALFLSRYGAETLPFVYLAAAALNTLTGIAYTTLQPRISFSKLMTGTLVFLLVSTVGLRAGLVFSDAGWLVFLLLVWYRVISILTDLEYWAVASRFYDVRQAKRLFGFIGAGEVIARISGAFSVPLLLAFTGVANLLVLSAVALASCLVVLIAVLKGADVAAAALAGEQAKPAPDKPGGPTAVFRKVAGNRYLSLIVAVAFFGVLGKYFVDFAFLEQMRSRYGGEKQIAAFFAIFSGVSQALSLLTRLFLSGRVLNRYGVKVGMLVLPLTQLVCTMLIVVAGGLPWTAGLVFWLVIANQGIYKTLKHPIDNPSFKVLYQPLRKNERLATQIAVETIVGPVTIGLAGLVMLLFSRVIPYDPTHFAFALLLTFAGWTFAAVLAGREYATALVRALKGRIEDVGFSFDREDSIAVLRKTLETGRPADVLFALDLLERSGNEQMGPLLTGLLEHSSPDVRLSALLRIERLKPPGALAGIRARAAAEDDTRLRGAALRALASLGGAEVFEEVSGALDDPDPQIRTGALIGLLEAGAPFARERLLSLARSSDPGARASAARIVAEVGTEALSAPLDQLLVDEVPEVRRAAIAAAGKICRAELWPLVMQSLADRAYCGAAANALVAGGDKVLPLLDAAFDPQTPPDVLLRIVQILGRMRSTRAAKLLEQRMDFPVEKVRDEILHSLNLCGYRASGSQVEAVETRIREETRDAAWKLAVLGDFGASSALELLRGALEAEVDQSRQRVFHLLSFILDPRAIRRARENRTHASREKRAYALEILDITLPRDLKPLLMPLLDDMPDRSARLSPFFPQSPAGVEQRLRELLDRSDEWVNPWTRACVLDAVAKSSAVDLTSSVETLLRSGSSTDFLRKTGSLTLSRLRSAAPGAAQAETEKETRPMQTIEKVIMLKAVQMFAETSEDVLADVASILEEMSVAKDEIIFKKGEVGDSMYIIIEGRVRVYDADRTIVHLGERDIFGELALLDPEPRLASIDAAEDTRLFRLDRDAFLELMSGSIEIVRGVLHVLCERLRRSTREVGPYLGDQART